MFNYFNMMKRPPNADERLLYRNGVKVDLDNAPVVVCFDGPDGCGKTSSIEALEKFLSTYHQGVSEERNLKVKIISILGESDDALAFRERLKEGKVKGISAALEVLVITTRMLWERIPELIEEGYDVILVDRSRASFYAYQLAVFGNEILSPVFEQLLRLDSQTPHVIDYFYIKTSLDDAIKNITARAKQEGIKSISKESIDGFPIETKKLNHQAYDEFFLGSHFLRSYLSSSEFVTTLDASAVRASCGDGVAHLHAAVIENFLAKYQARLNNRLTLNSK